MTSIQDSTQYGGSPPSNLRIIKKHTPYYYSIASRAMRDAIERASNQVELGNVRYSAFFPPVVYPIEWGSIYPFISAPFEILSDRPLSEITEIETEYPSEFVSGNTSLPLAWSPPPYTPALHDDGIIYRYLVGQWYTYDNCVPTLILQYVVATQYKGSQYLWNQEISQCTRRIRNQMISRTILERTSEGTWTNETVPGSDVPNDPSQQEDAFYFFPLNDDTDSITVSSSEFDPNMEDQSATFPPNTTNKTICTFEHIAHNAQNAHNPSASLHIDGGYLRTFIAHYTSTYTNQNPLPDPPKGYEGLFGSLTSLFADRIIPTDPEMLDRSNKAYSYFESNDHSFLTAFRWSMDNWRIIKDAPLFKHVRNLLGIAISLGFLPEEYGECHLKSVLLFQVEYNRWDSALTIIDALLEALSYFVEAVVASWECGNLMPMLHERTLARKFDEAYEYVTTVRHQIDSGEFGQRKLSWPDMIKKVRIARQLYEEGISLAPGMSTTRRIMELRLKVIRDHEVAIWSRRKGGEIVPQCPVVVYYGMPGCGKSQLMDITLKLMHHIKSPGIPFDESLVASINTDDAYDSTIGNDTAFFTFNDVANRPLKYDPSLGIAKVLQMADNVQFTATKAEVEMKGRVNPDLHGGVGSTNNATMHMEQLSVEPDSLRRRVMRTDVVVKPQFLNQTGGLDPLKVHAARAAGQVDTFRYGNNVLDKLQLFTINGPGSSGYEPLEFNDEGNKIRLANMELDVYLYYLEKVLRKHYADQSAHVERIKQFKVEGCIHCKQLFCTCISTPSVNAGTTDGAVVMENQSLFASSKWVGQHVTNAAFSVISNRLSSFIPSRLGILGAYWTDLPNRAQSAVTSNLTKMCWDIVDSHERMQWWWWVSDSFWNSSMAPKLASVLLDTELYKRIKRFKFWLKASLFSMATCFCAARFAPQYNIVISRTTVSGVLGDSLLGSLDRICTYFPQMTTLAHKCLFFLYKLDTPITIWTTDIFICIYLISVGVFAWSYFSQAYLIQQSYAYLSRKRNAISQNSQRFRSRYSTYVKVLLQGVLTLSGFFVAYRAFEWAQNAYDIKFGGKKEETTEPEDLSKKDARHSFAYVENQNYMAMNEAEMIKRNEKMDKWFETTRVKMVSFKNPNMTYEQLRQKVMKNLTVVFRKKNDEWKYDVNILWLCTSHALLPRHAVPTRIEQWKLQDNASPDSVRYVTVDPSNFTVCDSGDIAFVYLEYRHKSSLIPYLNMTPDVVSAHYVWKDPTSFITTNDGPYTGAVSNQNSEKATYLDWIWTRDTFVGACGGVYITPGRNPSIVGLHVKGGKDIKTLARSLIVSQKMVEAYLEQHRRESPSYFQTNGEPDSWQTSINGVELFEASQPSRLLESVQWLEEQEQLLVNQGCVPVGERNLSAFYKSRVVPTLIADEVQDKSSTKYGPPRFGRSMWAKTARYSFATAPGLPESHLDWAYRDYMLPFHNLSPYLKQHLRPLSWDEVLNGIRGVRFIDPMSFSTAMGLGYGGNKRAWFKQSRNENNEICYIMPDDVLKEALEHIELLKRGVRIPWLFNAVPKDEPTDVEKDKVRLFMVAVIMCTLLVRKYYTPVCRIIQMTTGVSECAVGMNPMSQDWDSVITYLKRFGRYFDGDFSKYDLRKDPRHSSVSYKIMMDIASQGDYTSEDLFIMEMIASELTRPLVNYNGEVYLQDGSTPSGIPVTVIINSLDNSIYNRCAFYSTYPHSRVGDFRKYVSHINYGDDFVNGVSWWRSDFNFMTMQKYLHSYGVVLTPGVKTAEPRKWLSGIGEVVFLQRKTVKLPGYSFQVGALNEKSILKSLLAVLSSPDLTLAQATAVNVDGALREYTLHGRAMFEERQKWLRDIMQKKGLAHLCTYLRIPHCELIKLVVEVDNI